MLKFMSTKCRLRLCMKVIRNLQAYKKVLPIMVSHNNLPQICVNHSISFSQPFQIDLFDFGGILSDILCIFSGFHIEIAKYKNV